jgi:hypothetical protein
MKQAEVEKINKDFNKAVEDYKKARDIAKCDTKQKTLVIRIDG